MKNKIIILNGPNLNLLGKRQPELYGTETLADIEIACSNLCHSLNFDLEFYQSNAEHNLIDAIHTARSQAQALIINPAAFTHTSIAIHDALLTFEGPIIEVHLTNIYKREEFRHHSYISPVATGVITGLGRQGYLLALRYLHSYLLENNRQEQKENL